MEGNKFTGKTVQSIEVIRAEYGRTYDKYSCVVFTDGTKALIGADLRSMPWNPNPALDEMSKAPNYFSAEDISIKVLSDEKDKRLRREKDVERKLRQYEQLKKDLDL